MPHWLLKAIPQKALSLLPGGMALHRWWQQQMQQQVLTDFHVRDRLSHAARHWRAWQDYGPGYAPQCLEIGGGWHPIVPFGLWLCGAESVLSSDIHLRMSAATVQATYTALRQRETLVRALLPSLLPQRWEQVVAQPPRLIVTADAITLAPYPLTLRRSARGELPAAGGSIDLLSSNNTLEHIPRPEIPALLQAARLALRPQGVSSHYIDLTDHYSYFDPRLSPFHFLRYRERTWHLIENRLQSQNRLRASQWQDLLTQAGYDLLWQEAEPGSPADLARVPLHADFQSFHPRDLRVRYVHVVGRGRGN